MGLSLRAIGHEASRAAVESYKADTHKHPVSSSTTTLGDLINWRKNEQALNPLQLYTNSNGHPSGWPFLSWSIRISGLVASG